MSFRYRLYPLFRRRRSATQARPQPETASIAAQGRMLVSSPVLGDFLVPEPEPLPEPEPEPVPEGFCVAVGLAVGLGVGVALGSFSTVTGPASTFPLTSAGAPSFMNR